jgi:lysophospholipase L1-like esterase
MDEISNDFDDLIDPFWQSTTMHRESVMFIGRDGSSMEATLLFRPDHILSVTSAGADIAYREGTDYQVDWHEGRITRPPGSRMPSVTPASMTAADGALTHERTISVSYSHNGDRWRRFVPASARAQLPGVTRRLEGREPLTVCLTGDSISEGYDASGFHRLTPYQPPYGTLVASGLERAVGTRIQFYNFGTAGWTSADALWDTERIAAVNPDLVIVAFGMNDATYADADEYVANVSGILSRVSAEVAHAEFVLVSSMLPTPECDWLVHARFAEYRDALARLTGDGVALADVTTVWTAVLARKSPHDLSGNGWNHPNDFGHRIYAQTILATMGCGSRADL